MAALLLVALWLPAVLHCRVENLIGLDCCPTAEERHDEKKSCESDICDSLEAGYIKSSSAQLVAPAPQLCAGLYSLALARSPAEISAPPMTGIRTEAAAPPEIFQSRHFLARSALPARDPDCVS